MNFPAVGEFRTVAGVYLRDNRVPMVIGTATGTYGRGHGHGRALFAAYIRARSVRRDRTEITELRAPRTERDTQRR